MTKPKGKRKQMSAVDGKQPVRVIQVPPKYSEAFDRFYSNLLRYGAIGISSESEGGEL